MRRRGLRILISVAFSAVFLILAVRNVDLQRVIDAFAGVEYVLVLPMLLITWWSLLVRAQRWQVLLSVSTPVELRPLLSATNIGFMANMILPLRAGEVIRPLLVSRSQRLPLSGLLATILLERMFDMFTVLALFGVGAWLVPFSEDIRRWGFVFTGIAAAVGVVMALVRWQEDTALAVVRRLTSLLPRPMVEPVRGFGVGFIRALDVLDSPRRFARAFLWSVYLWMVIASIYLLGLFAFDLDAPPLVASFVTVAIIAIAVSVPSAPGYIGSFQLGCTVALGIFGVEESVALAYSVVLHLAQFVGTVSAGLFSLWRENVRLVEVERMGEEVDEPH